MTITGKKDDANRVPVRVSFGCTFAEDNSRLIVTPGSVVRRGYVWAPDRDRNEGETYLAFDVEVRGLSAVADGKLYLNARVQPVAPDGGEGTGGYALTDGVITVKEVLKQSLPWGIFNAAGLLAEFNVVGAFSAAPAPAAANGDGGSAA
ncbi:unnamed protein product [Phaeothamnion confervicola]